MGQTSRGRRPKRGGVKERPALGATPCETCTRVPTPATCARCQELHRTAARALGAGDCETCDKGTCATCAAMQPRPRRVPYPAELIRAAERD